MEKVKIFIIYLGGGLILPLIFIVNALAVPEPYSHPLIDLALSPNNFAPILFYFVSIEKYKEFLHNLTPLVFGRMTQNDAPIAMLMLLVFWFFLSILILFVWRFTRSKINLY